MATSPFLNKWWKSSWKPYIVTKPNWIWLIVKMIVMVYFCRILMFLNWFSFLLFCFQWCHPSTHSGLVTHICIKEVQGNKFESKYDINIFFQRKCNWKCCPQYVGHFIQASVGVFSFGISTMVLINWLTAVLVTMVTWWSFRAVLCNPFQ